MTSFLNNYHSVTSSNTLLHASELVFKGWPVVFYFEPSESLPSVLLWPPIHSAMWDNNSTAAVIAAHQEWWNFASGMWHFHQGARRFGILVTHHEPDFKEVWGDARQGVCHLQSGSRVQVEALHLCVGLFLRFFSRWCLFDQVIIKCSYLVHYMLPQSSTCSYYNPIKCEG